MSAKSLISLAFIPAFFNEFLYFMIFHCIFNFLTEVAIHIAMQF